MDALARLFHEDAVFVNVLGTYVRGREEIRRQHAAVHAGPYKGSILRAEIVAAREPVPGVIVAHARTSLTETTALPARHDAPFVTFVIERTCRTVAVRCGPQHERAAATRLTEAAGASNLYYADLGRCFLSPPAVGGRE